MSHDDTLMDVVTVNEDEVAGDFEVWCDWGCGLVGMADDLFTANDWKIDHENEHGIYADPDTGALYHDPEDDQHSR
jgi:hypothetical protein